MLTAQQVNNIAASAIALYEALQAHGADDNGQADRWVGQSMMAIVMAEVDEPDVTFPEELRPDHHAPGWAADKGLPPDTGWRGGKSDVLTSIDPDWPSPVQQDAKQEQLRAEQARWGDVSRDDRNEISPAILQQLALGPAEGQDMRLVRLSSLGKAGENARREVMSWVRDNVQEAGPIRTATWAGRAVAGESGYLYPVYLVTYELKTPGGPVRPVRYSDKPLG